MNMRNIRIIILLSLFSSCISLCGYSCQPPIFSHKRIIGGITARKHAWPWIVNIHRMEINDPDVAFCSGSLINEKYILTAAHCFSNLNHSLISNYFVIIGSDYINDTNRFKIKSIRLHENYDENLYLNDIALVELSFTVNLNHPNIGFICLPPQNISIYPYEQMEGTVVGWGSLKENSSMSYTLQEIQLPIISNKDEFCIQQISDDITQFCAGFIKGGKDACQGDSGGPLMIYDRSTRTWHIAGIISYGFGCARPENPGVYTRVSMFVDWIDQHINSSSIMQMPLKILLLLFFTVMYF